VKGLQALGLRVVMLTGDHASTAQRVAEDLAIDEVIAGLKPEEKLREVYQARDAGRKVVVAGDGIDDAPALAAAHVGIAMGTGTDVAMQSADVTPYEGRSARYCSRPSPSARHDDEGHPPEPLVRLPLQRPRHSYRRRGAVSADQLVVEPDGLQESRR